MFTFAVMVLYLSFVANPKHIFDEEFLLRLAFLSVLSYFPELQDLISITSLCLVISLLMQFSRCSICHLPFLIREKVVGLNGLEPSTSRLSGVRSNQLSYKPIADVLRVRP